MKPFTFAPRDFTDDFREKDFVHIRNGVSAEFLEFARLVGDQYWPGQDPEAD